MIRMTLTLAALAATLTTTPSVGAREPTKEVKVVKEKFHVYGGRCSRSISLQGTFDDIRDACNLAEKLRDKDKMNWVSVRTGAHDRDHFGTNAKVFKVYRNPCKGFFLDATVDSAAKAKELADKFKKDGDRVEIVLHYPSK